MCDISPTLSIINSNFHIAERFFIIYLSEALPHCRPLCAVYRTQPLSLPCNNNSNISNISLRTYRHPSQDKILICDAIFVSSCRGRPWLSGGDMQIQDISQSSSDLVKSYNTFSIHSISRYVLCVSHHAIYHSNAFQNKPPFWLSSHPTGGADEEHPQAIHMTICTSSHALWWRWHYHLNDILLNNRIIISRGRRFNSSTPVVDMG